MEEISPYNFEDLEVQPKKYRCFTFVAYEASYHYKFDSLLFNLKSYKYWAYIKHMPQSTEKEVHFHFIIKLDNATTIDSISKKLGIPKNYIQYVRNERAMCRYLIHFDDPQKLPYNFEDIHISRLWERKFKKHFEDLKTEEEIISDIYYWLSNNHYNSYQEKLMYFVMWVNMSGFDSVYKRYRFEFLDYLKCNL